MSHVETMSLNESQASDNEELVTQGETFSELSLDSEAAQVDEGQQDSAPVQAKENLVSKEKGQKFFYDTFLAEMTNIQEPEAKLQHVVAFMETSLSQHGSPHFKSFWDARALCLDLFKENLSPAVRSVMWAKYTELSKEARRLKEILDEQSAFAAEQIEIAVSALVQEIQSNQERLQGCKAQSLLPVCEFLEKKRDFYESSQHELNFLNVQASRINGLRRELIRTEMRVRQKNKFFQQLSEAGDLVFPKRKELIKEISQRFLDDVDGFISVNFGGEDYRNNLFVVREEIKILQGVAKILTLNTHAFTQTRMRLSEAWDKIKGAEKERKKERAQIKGVHRQNAQEILEQIQEFQNAFAAGALSVNAAQEQLDEIFSRMKSTDLGRDEVKELRDHLNEARKPVFEKIKADEELRHAAEVEREKQKREKITALRQSVDALMQEAKDLEVEELLAKREAKLEEIAQAPVTKLEKQELERVLKSLKDIIADKREKALLNLSDDDRQALSQLKELLKERKERRQDIKNQIEIYRKASGGSGLDFEKAMAFNAQIAEEKDRFERMNEGVRELEKKIAELENKA